LAYLCLLALIASPLHAQNGAAIYKQKCASCHEAPAARVPSLSTIKAMSGEAIYLALTRGVMKTQADGLSSAQIFSLLGYIAPTAGASAAAPQLTPTCATQRAFSVSTNTPEWNGWSTQITNTCIQAAASAGLTSADLGRLKLTMDR